MEPDERYYDAFVKPLLEQPNSSFRYTTLSGAHPKSYWESYRQIFNGELLPEREPLRENDPRLRQPDNSLLVTGSIYRTYKDWRRYSNHVHLPNLILGHMAQASQTNGLFHTHGLVRMLLWQPEEAKSAIVPRTVAVKTAFSTAVSNALEPIEVATQEKIRSIGDDRRAKEFRERDIRLDEESMVRTIERMEQNKIEPPTNRQSEDYKAALERRKAIPVKEPIYTPQQPDLPLAERISFLESGLDALEKALSKRKRAAMIDIPTKFRFGANTFTHAFSPYALNRIGPILDLQMELIDVEKQYATEVPNLSDKERSEYKDRLVNFSQRLQKTNSVITNVSTSGATKLFIEEQRALEMDPPILAYDRRPYEALVTQEDEFYPRYPLCLLDLQPYAENLASDITTSAEGNRTARQFLTSLFVRPSYNVLTALDKIAPNAAHDLLPLAPAITDPLKGGRLDPTEVQVKMLTREMHLQLARAFIEWPFKPSDVEMSMQTEGVGGSDAGNEASEEL